ncbi:PTS system, beta-glucoside-specific IIABC component [Enterococcus phoeniculicola]|jgi:PTS system beta-glucosides-specific IIC component|uniref:PTS system sucrose-specific EIIBCA component n=1 Tax=Enterococcus phoeniculicola ATCC BAA-412 TaxID=1158610 RepID=R3WL06_9ENTE|nr:beta-glucoside-specific PTS transporter subunit IIABC [Enterococcus phoeniculicola]EOL42555.1 PTS system, beta-glucoside-specific IIABC component [Enterococcus phoeniculicola ATCC BAA-412]EOT79166.1 PTS system beta-glucoside-specific transporter subunit IIABC [Enterococcus phoeniculicola ATCC BAA-412]OJG71009.1 PTS system, beta-glucoside-specific IIABC component [Enterococcus phoeniculicola]
MDYKKVGKEVLQQVGGKDNVVNITHCATRLRFELVDKKKVNTKQLESIEGVISVVDGGGQYQVIIGNEVQTAFKEIQKEIGTENSKSKKETTEKESLVSRLISVISTTFTPMIPAITGAGMVKAILAILTLTGLLSDSSQTYIILNTIADAAFYFMPILLAYGASIKFDVSPILAITVAGILLHPNISQLFSTGESVTFIGIPVLAADYAGSVLPIILTVWIMSYVDRFAEKVSPSFIKFFTKPMLIFLIMGPLALIVIGPFGTLLNDLVASAAEWINGKAEWLIPFLMGGLQPFLVVTGTAWAMTPIATMQLSKNGSEMINGPGMLASNIAQSGATFAVAVKTKNKELKQLAASSGITALMGITEPSLYGVTLKLKTPLIAAMIGGALGGLYAGLSGLVRYAFVSPGLAALPAFIGENPMNIVHAIITCLISFIATFFIAYIIGFEDIPDEEMSDTIELTKVMAPVKGEVISLSEVNDGVFSKELLGKGVAIKPEESMIVSPVEGEIVTVLKSKHAIGIRSKEGIELLIHVGIDTVNLNGAPFEVFVEEGEHVTVGQKLIQADFDKINAAGYDNTVILVVTNSEQFPTISEHIGIIAEHSSVMDIK